MLFRAPRKRRGPPISRAPAAARRPCRGCADKRAAELVAAARARGASQDEVLRLLREQRERGG